MEDIHLAPTNRIKGGDRGLVYSFVYFNIFLNPDQDAYRFVLFPKWNLSMLYPFQSWCSIGLTQCCRASKLVLCMQDPQPRGSWRRTFEVWCIGRWSNHEKQARHGWSSEWVKIASSDLLIAIWGDDITGWTRQMPGIWKDVPWTSMHWSKKRRRLS